MPAEKKTNTPPGYVEKWPFKIGEWECLPILNKHDGYKPTNPLRMAFAGLGERTIGPQPCLDQNGNPVPVITEAEIKMLYDSDPCFTKHFKPLKKDYKAPWA